MADNKNYNQVPVLIVGAGPAGLACAIQLKVEKPDIDVCIIEKALAIGNHNLSGAVLEDKALHELLDAAQSDWQDSDEAKDILSQRVEKDDILFMPCRKTSFNIIAVLKIAKKLGLGFGEMLHGGDYIVSVSKLTSWLGKIAAKVGVEILTGFAAEDIIYDEALGKATGVKLVDQGLNKEREKQPNYVKGEVIKADFIVLAEGCDGLLTEKFVKKASLKRLAHQLYSLGVKELIKVSPEQYEKFTTSRVVHAMGYPIWTPLIGPGVFGGGIMYPGINEHISVGMIAGTDWKYRDFNPQDALVRFKEHKFVKQFIEDGKVVEAGAHLIPEGGYYAVPRDPQTDSIGKGNVMLLGDSAGFVNMQKIKGLHNAIDSGMQAAHAIVAVYDNPENAAVKYTQLIKASNIDKEMKSAMNYRQTVARFGNLIGFPMSVFGKLLPKFNIEEDYKATTEADYRLKPDQNFDKDTFTAVAATEHREDQPCHLDIINQNICIHKCYPKYKYPCIVFCPAGVYEMVKGQLKAANPSNCLHCKTCQRKCPFDNIRWTVPEGGGGPRYKRM